MQPAAVHEHEGGLQVKRGKFTWVPTQKVEEEIVRSCINKRDRHFVRFCTGKALDLRSSKSGASVDGDLYMNILAARQEAFDKALSERLQAEDEAREEQKAKKRKVKPMKAAAKHRDYAPHHLTMKMPALEEVGDQLECKVLFEGVGSTAIWLELTEDVLVYLRVGFSKMVPRDPKPRVAKGK